MSENVAARGDTRSGGRKVTTGGSSPSDTPAAEVTDSPDPPERGPSDMAPGGSTWAVPEWLDRLASWTWRLGVVAIGGYYLLRLFWMLRLVAVPVLFALVFAALLWPLRRRLTEHRVPDTAAAVLLVSLVLTLVAGAVWIASIGVGNQLSGDVRWEETVTRIEEWFVDGPVGLTPAEVDDYQEQLTEQVSSGAWNLGVSRARVAVDVAGAIALTVLLVFFSLKDGPKIWGFVEERIRPGRRSAVSRAGAAAFDALGGYARGITVSGIVDGAAVGIVMTVLGVPLALPFAVLTFLAAYLPIVGATIVGGLSTVVALVTVGPREAVILAVATLAIQQIEGDVILPMVMSAQVRLHPALVLVVLALGGAVAGVVGAVVSVPIAAMGSAALRSFRSTSSATDEPAQQAAGSVEET